MTVSSNDLPQKAISIPSSAILKTAMGSFVFVQNGEFLLRTEVKTGNTHDDRIQIVEGLYEGDVIVRKPVEMLYLIELRATKGGGHSH